jgi:hypothetical protein
MTPLPFVFHDMAWAWPSLVWYGIVNELGRVRKATVQCATVCLAWHGMCWMAWLCLALTWDGVEWRGRHSWCSVAGIDGVAWHDFA